MVTFYPAQLNPSRPFSLASPANFTAEFANPEQWVEAVAAMGGRYAVLNVKDESGFLLYPTKCKTGSSPYGYTIAESEHFAKTGDLTKRFVEACRRNNIKAGIYYLVWGNFYMNMTNSGGTYDCAKDNKAVRAYEQLTLCQLNELFTEYGSYAEIWNDGGAPCRPEFENAIAELTAKYQPNSVIFQGPKQWKNDIRWIGTEEGTAPFDTWSSAGSSQDYGGGQRDGHVFVPAEADTCIRTATCPVPGVGSNGCWVWCPNTTSSVKSFKTLRDSYLTTVGRNANFFLNVSPNTNGTIDKEDMAAYRQLGAWIKQSFGPGRLLARKTNITVSEGTSVDLVMPLADGRRIRYLHLLEDQTDGQRIWGWQVLGRAALPSPEQAGLLPQWTPLFSGQSIGHKRILDCGESDKCDNISTLRFNATLMATKQKPSLREFAAFAGEDETKRKQ